MNFDLLDAPQGTLLARLPVAGPEKRADGSIRFKVSTATVGLATGRAEWFCSGEFEGPVQQPFEVVEGEPL